MEKKFLRSICLALLFLSRTVSANDSTAVLATGGIILTKTSQIKMLMEDLYISPNKITVKYVFKNITDDDVKTFVSFPLPDLEMETLSEVPIAGMEESPSDNFLNFEATADGRPVALIKNSRAFVKGQDISSILDRHRLPWRSMTRNLLQRIGSLGEGKKAHLAQLAAIANHGTDANAFWVPAWTVKTEFHWEQVFPAQKSISISHQYKPIIGKTYFTRADIEYEKLARQNIANFCLDSETTAILSRKLPQENDKYWYSATIGYVLTTGANWAGPIESFRVVLDKGDTGNILSTCLPGVKRLSETQFVAEDKNFTPTKDLLVLIVSPLPF